MTHWAKPGVQCVCIDDGFGFVKIGGVSIPTRQPMLNEVLTVKTVGAYGDMVILTFEEIEVYQSDSNGTDFLGGEVRWDAAAFRPLIKRPTDISIFKAMLTPAGRIPVDA